MPLDKLRRELGATGVSAWEIKRDSGWQVKFGPVRARDLRVFLSNGLKKNDEMRRVRFPFRGAEQGETLAKEISVPRAPSR